MVPPMILILPLVLIVNHNASAKHDAGEQQNWNRCLPETVARLSQFGFSAYSADHVVECGGPAMLPVSLDWERALRDQNLVEALAAILSAPSPQAGIMLDDEARADFVSVNFGHDLLRVKNMAYG